MTEPAWKTVVIAPGELEAWRAEHPYIDVVDDFEAMLEELFRSRHVDTPKGSPGYDASLATFREEYPAGRATEACGEWHYYPWLGRLVHLLPRDEHRLVRASRNQDLITADEQAILEGAKVGIPGLSVGSQIVKGLILTSAFAEIRIADFDTVELSNLQRLGAGSGLADMGLPKWVQAARTIAEHDPWTKVTVFPDGLTDDNLKAFIDGLDVTVCAMDDLLLKLKLRQVAKRHRVPVVMATDTENVFLDVEPHHTDEAYEPFHGMLTDGDIAALEAASPEDKRTFIALAMKIIGLDHHTAELLSSLPRIGRGLVSQPQLGTSAMMSGAAAARTVVRLLLGKPVPHGRTVLGVETLLDPSFHDDDKANARLQLTQALMGPPPGAPDA